jgi:hypothetical protein
VISCLLDFDTICPSYAKKKKIAPLGKNGVRRGLRGLVVRMTSLLMSESYGPKFDSHMTIKAKSSPLPKKFVVIEEILWLLENFLNIQYGSYSYQDREYSLMECDVDFELGLPNFLLSICAKEATRILGMWPLQI